jgi:hypothetical protein
MKIGDLTLVLFKRPVDELDAELVALTGICTSEMHKMLGIGPCLAGMMARAIVPLLKDAVHPVTLAQEIAKDDAERVRSELHAFYGRIIDEEGELNDGTDSDSDGD